MYIKKKKCSLNSLGNVGPLPATEFVFQPRPLFTKPAFINKTTQRFSVEIKIENNGAFFLLL